MSNPGGVDFNVSPHYDDFDEDKKFARILFRPGRAVQARELTQLQSILQKQVERFGNYFFNEGSIVDGCEQTLDLNLSYLKLQPTYNSNTVSVADFLTKEIVGANSGVRAKVGIVSDIEGNDPKTLYINYVASGLGVLTVNAIPSTLVVGNSIGNANASATIRYWDPTLLKIYVSDPVGNVAILASPTPVTVTTLDSNSAVVVMSATQGVDGREIKEFANGEIVFTTAGLASRVYANSQATFATSTIVNDKLYSKASKVTVGDGVIYLSDHFVKHSEQSIILDKYSNEPTYKIGIVTEKNVVDYIEDNTLVDNAQGTPNYQAPGADRFKIDTVLTKIETDIETSESEFITLMDVQNGLIRKRKSFGIESKIEEVISNRTYEESGDYTLSNPKIAVREHLLQGENDGRYNIAEGGNTNLLLIEVDPFTAYVKGFRSEFISKQEVELRKGLDIQYVDQNKTQINYGNYVEVKEMVGAWDIMEASKVDLYSVPFAALTNRTFASTSANTALKIGEARVRSIDYVSGIPGTPSAVYNLFLFDVTMNSGQSFRDVRAVYSTGRFADLVLDELGDAVLKESSFNNAIFQLPYEAIRTLRDVNNDIESSFVFKKTFDINFTTAGQATVSTGDNDETFVGTGLLSDTQKNESYLVIPNSNVTCTFIPGTISVTNNTSTVTGSGTDFINRFDAGDFITVGTQVNRILSIQTATQLTLATNHTGGNVSGANTALFLPAGAPIRLTGKGSSGSASDRAITVTIPGSTSLTIELRENSAAGFSAKFVASLNRLTAREMKKILFANQSVYIQANTHPNGLNGPYTLGRSDVYQIRGIYQSSDFLTNPTTANTDVTGLYSFDNGQRDNTYEHSTITPKIGVTPTGRLLVVYDYFSHDTTQGLSYLSVDSYPIDDVNESNTTINTSDIPVYTSTTSGYTYNLRNCLDFRLRRKDDSANTVNPYDSGTYQVPLGGLHIPVPLTDFDSSLSLYKGRISRLFLTENGEFGILDGSPGYPTSKTPDSVPGTLDLAVISIPPYPSDPNDVVIESQNNNRYTMRDIGKIEERVNRLEYYTSLNLLEKQAAEVSILDENGIEKFKGGILVDPYTGYSVADVNNSDIATAISKKEKFATSKIDLNQIGMQYDSASSTDVVRTNGNKVILNYTQEIFSQNPYASSALNLAQTLNYDWIGIMTLYPTTDNWMNTTNYPKRNLVTDLEGNSDNWRKLSDAWETEYDSWESRWIGTPVVKEPTKTITQVARVFGVNSKSQYDSITTNVKVGPVSSQSITREVDVSVNHFMRSRDYIFSVNGLKPYSRLYAFLDGKSVITSCKSITVQSGYDINDVFDLINSDGTLQVANTVYVSANTGELYANANGEITGVFTLPANKFFVGQREFKLSDNSKNNDLLATTTAKSIIIAQGLSLTSTGNQLNTRPPNVSFTSNVEKDTADKQVGVSGAAIRTPLSQSFYVNNVNYPYGVYLTTVGVYFKSKSSDPNAKVYMQIREMRGGFPTRITIGDSTAFVKASQITTSNTATQATNFVFENPIYLLPGKDYCFSLIPEGNKDDFEIWISELKQIDISSPFTKARIEKQAAAGFLFTSSNDYAWSIRRNEDLKYDMYVANFDTATTGYAQLTNKNIQTDVNYSSIIPNLSILKPNRTTVAIESRVSDTVSNLTAFTGVNNLELVNYSNRKAVVDQTQETNDGIKSITYRMTMRTQNKYVSPVIDLERIQSIIYDNEINSLTYTSHNGTVTYTSGSNTVTGYGTYFNGELSTGEIVKFGDQYRQIKEITSNTSLVVLTNFTANGSNVSYTSMNEENPSGPYASESRYISRRVELADGFEANDLTVYLDVNRPVGTDIKVYYKVLNEADSDTFDSKFYQEMTLDGNATFNEDPSKYAAEKFVVPSAIKSGGSNVLSGTVDISSSTTTVTGTSTRFIEQLRIGDTVRVDSDTRVVTTIANNTSLTVDSTFSTTASGKEMYKMLYNSIIYTTPDNRTYSGYKYFAIKIVFLSNNPAIAPRVKKLRAIAVS